MRLKILFFLCCLSLCFSAIAQPSKKAGSYYGIALRYKAKKKNDKACAMMERSIAKDPTFPDAYSQLGQWYFEMHKFREAAEVFKQASLKCLNGGMRFARPYVKSLVYSGNAEKALQ